MVSPRETTKSIETVVPKRTEVHSHMTEKKTVQTYYTHTHAHYLILA